MKKGGGSKKGSPFERLICSQLSLWWTDGASDDVFYRTAGSGGRATRRGRKGQSTVNHCGDIGASDPIGMPLLKLMAIECKRGYNKECLQGILDAPPPKKGSKKDAVPVYQQWFDQAEESAKHAGSVGWAVIVRRDKRRALIMMGAGTAGKLHVAAPAAVILPRILLHRPDGSFVVAVRLEDFLKAFDRGTVCRAVGEPY